MKIRRICGVQGFIPIFLISLLFFAIIWEESCPENRLVCKCAQQEKGTEEQQGSICGAGSIGTSYMILLVQVSCSNLNRIKFSRRS